MSVDLRGIGGRLVCTWSFALALLCGLAASAAAQDRPHPRVEFYGGYSAIDYGGAVYGVLPGGETPSTACLCWNPHGAGAGVTFDFNRWFGLTADMSGHWGDSGSTTFERFDHASFYNISAGPTFTYRLHHFSPFAEFLGGGHRLVPGLFHPDDAFGFMAGGGVDIPISTHISFRMIRADFVHSSHQFGPSSVPATNVNGARLQSGIVFMFGGAAPVIAAALPVRAPLPMPQAAIVLQAPMLQCSANPSMVNAGESALITANATSAQNRALSYSFSANAGLISGTNAMATLSTAGAALGVIVVTCTVVDDRGQTASQTTEVTVTRPVIAAKIATSDLCSISFGRDTRRPARVNNEAKACLDEIALNLQRNADATIAVIGNVDPVPGGDEELGAQRAVNTKAYLVREKGIDPSRVQVYTGSQHADTVSTTLIPAGATLDTAGDTPVDESQVHRAPAATHRHSHSIAH